MPRPRKPPRLWLRERPGREPIWVILDAGSEISTGCGPGCERGAEEALARYLASKHQPHWGEGDPRKVYVADVLTLYAEEVVPEWADPIQFEYHLAPLLDFFGQKTCWEVEEGSCRAYVRTRQAGLAARAAVKRGTARRELVTLQAALNYTQRRRKLSQAVPVWLPPEDEPRVRWLTRSEVARLLAGALGFEVLEIDDAGRPSRWRRAGPPSYHVARFILIALYSGTRHEAVLRLGWSRNPDRGWIDLPSGVLNRRGYDERDSNKRRVPAPINWRLAPHLRRWRRLTKLGPCEYQGEIIAKQRTGWKRARIYAGLGEDVTPHTLKHTCITWMLQAGVSTWDVAGYVGTSERIISKVYGHHATEHLVGPRQAFRRKPGRERQ